MKDSLMDLLPMFDSKRLEQFDQRAIKAFTIDGKLLAIPSFLDSTLLYYRRDLLQKYNLSVPRTWDELEIAALRIQNGERQAGVADFWGLQWQGAANEILTVLTYTFIASHGGGSFVNETGHVDIQNARAKAAVERVRGWITTSQITPSRIVNQHLHETKALFLYQKAAFLLDLTHISGEAHGFKPQGCDICAEMSIAVKVSYAHIPGLTWSDRATSPWYWGWAVNKYSPSMIETLRVVDYLASPQQQIFKARQ
ncbi:unnamed protein product, partial [Polarella glacialis]